MANFADTSFVYRFKVEVSLVASRTVTIVVGQIPLISLDTAHNSCTVSINHHS